MVEDLEAEGHSPSESLQLTIKRFGQPFRVGRQIAQKWEAKRQLLNQKAQPRLARRLRWLGNIRFFLLVSVPVLIETNYHPAWRLILVGAVVIGCLVGSMETVVERMEVQLNGPFSLGPLSEYLVSAEKQEQIKENLPEIRGRIRVSKSLWGKCNLYAAQWASVWAMNGAQKTEPTSRTSRRSVVWQLLGLIYLAALIWWPVSTDASVMAWRYVLAFWFVSGKVSARCQRLMKPRFKYST